MQYIVVKYFEYAVELVVTNDYRALLLRSGHASIHSPVEFSLLVKVARVANARQ